MDGGVVLKDVVLTALVTLVACLQMARFARLVGNARRKHKVEPPAVDGPPEFLQTFRAQQNCLEFFPLFIVTLWMASLFFHQVPAAVLGLWYCYARQSYFHGYCKDAKERVPGFKMSVLPLQGLLGLGSLGVVHCLLVTYLGINLKPF